MLTNSYTEKLIEIVAKDFTNIFQWRLSIREQRRESGLLLLMNFPRLNP